MLNTFWLFSYCQLPIQYSIFMAIVLFVGSAAGCVTNSFQTFLMIQQKYNNVPPNSYFWRDRERLATRTILLERHCRLQPWLVCTCASSGHAHMYLSTVKKHFSQNKVNTVQKSKKSSSGIRLSFWTHALCLNNFIIFPYEWRPTFSSNYGTNWT